MTRELRRAWLATALWFALNGMSWANFAVRMPDIKHALNISNSELGIALFIASLGVLGSLKLAGKWSAKFGSAPVMVFGALGMAALLPVVGSMASILVFEVSVFVMMFFLATMDVAMNAHAVAIEHGSGQLVMGRLHGLWSVGSIFGGLVGGALAGAQVGLQTQAFAVAAVVAVTVLALRPWLLPAEADRHEVDKEEQPKEKTRTPRIFVVLGLIGLCAAIGEGSASDWGAILLRDTWNAGAFLSSVPYIVFQTGMVIGRFSSDALTQKFGRARVLLVCGLVGGLGEIAGLLIGGASGVIFGWLCVGLGVSVVIPTVFSLAGSIAKERYAGVIAPSQAVATVSAASYSAFMLGPTVIGFLADQISLRWAMLFPAVLVLGVSAGSRLAKAADH